MQPEILEGIVSYLADPLDQRTNAEVAESLGISEPTFYAYKRDNSKYIDDQVSARLPGYRAKLRQAGYKALGARLKKSDNAIKLLFQLLGDLVERTEQNVTYRTLEEKRNEIKTKLSQMGLSITLSDGSPKDVIENKNSSEIAKSAEKANK